MTCGSRTISAAVGVMALWLNACGGSATKTAASSDAVSPSDVAATADAADIAQDVSAADTGPADASLTDIGADSDTGAPDSGLKLGCGDGICTSPETNVTCPGDCKKPVCGDGFCQTPENPNGCPLDCAPATLAELACIAKLCPSAVSDCSKDVTCAGVLGSALDCASSAGGEATIIANCAQSLTLNAKSAPLTAAGCGFTSCAGSTNGAICGDGVCQPTESSASCVYDCLGVAGKCGDGVCSGSETSTTCPADCKTAAICGNGTCEPGEDSANCPADCPVIAVCGNGVCDTGETASGCALDCDAALKAKADCLRAKCGGEFDPCVAEPACITAITTDLQCQANCATGDILCALGCESAVGNATGAKALATCAGSSCP